MRNRDRPSEEEKKGTLKVREGSNPSARDGGRGESETEKKIERERETERFEEQERDGTRKETRWMCMYSHTVHRTSQSRMEVEKREGGEG